ncbi:MAG: transcription-repair coupling factor, partial [Spirochaetaceae bacterium]|nr:transcription-repair coupling factor [Spirochaetaceae bacterium]
MSEIISAEKKISAIREFDQLVTAYNAGQFPLKISGVHGSLTAFILKEIFKIKINKTLVVAPTDREAAELQIDLSALGVPCSLFPGWGTVPYRDLPLISGVFAERSKVLSGLCITGNASEIIVTSERAFLTPVPPVEYTKKLIFTITKGDKLDTISLSKTLSEYGWTRVQRVQMPGEFVLHGEVMDMLLGTNNEAYRIVLDFDTVESIKRFDPADQSSIEQVDHFSIYPLKEFFWTDDLIDTLNSNLAQMPEFKDGGKKTIECLIQERKIVGEENLFPLAFKKSASIADYLENGDIVFLDRERLENSQEILEKEYLNLFRNALRERCVPAPSHLLLNFNDLASNVKRCISFLSIRNNLSDSININSSPAKSFFGNINFMKEEFTTLLENGWKIVIAAHSEVQAVRLAELLKDLPDIQIIIAQLSQGFSVNAVKFIL